MNVLVFLEQREGDHDLVGEILRDTKITEAQKQTLISVYEAFCHENEGILTPPAGEEQAVGD